MNNKKLLIGAVLVSVGMVGGLLYGSTYGLNLPFRDKGLKSEASVRAPGGDPCQNAIDHAYRIETLYNLGTATWTQLQEARDRAGRVCGW